MSADKPRRSRGRPKKDLLEDLDRYPIAMAIALRDAMELSERKSFDLVVGLFLGEEIQSHQSERAPSQHRDKISLKLVSKPGAPATIAGAASTLRQKAKTNRTPEEAAWLTVMALAFTIVFTATDYDRGAARIRELAASIGEIAYCEAKLIPMLWAKFHSPIFPRGSV